jgi:hypothetical protein
MHTKFLTGRAFLLCRKRLMKRLLPRFEETQSTFKFIGALRQILVDLEAPEQRPPRPTLSQEH